MLLLLRQMAKQMQYIVSSSTLCNKWAGEGQTVLLFTFAECVIANGTIIEARKKLRLR